MSSNNTAGQIDAKLIDHTLLAPDARADQIVKICKEAIEFGFYSVCVNTSRVPLVAEQLKGTPVVVCAVVGFPLGAMLPEAKAFETRAAIEQGAGEIDMVLNVGWVKDGNFSAVKDDIAQVLAACGKVPLKVILETALLDDNEKVKTSEICRDLGVAFVKTSTGFSKGGATVEDVRLMRATVGNNVGVKASGGIRSRDIAQAMVDAGATRLGASAGIAIVTDTADGKGGY